MGWFKKLKSTTLAQRTVFFARITSFFNFVWFAFRLITGICFNSIFLIVSAGFSFCNGSVRRMCYKSINRYDDSLKTLQKFRNGGLILTAASLCYIGYSTFMIFVPTNFQYGMIISIAIATFSFTNLVLAIIGIVKTKGKNILLREIKVTNLAAALTNIVLTQIAILSFTFAEDASLYNGLMGIGVGFIILIMGVVLSIRGQNKIIKFRELENKKEESSN